MSKLFVVLIFSIFVFNGYHVIEAAGNSDTKVEVYFNYGSNPSRAVALTLMVLGVPYKLKEINLLARDQKKSEFLKVNPLGKVPAIKIGDFLLWESHTINSFLVNEYGKYNEGGEDSTGKLYPKESKTRAIVDLMLYFDDGVLSVVVRDLTYKVIGRQSMENLDQTMIEGVTNAYKLLNTFLKERKYIAGDTITIADFSIITTLENANVLVPISENEFPLLKKYIDHDWDKAIKEAIQKYNSKPDLSSNISGYNDLHKRGLRTFLDGLKLAQVKGVPDLDD